MLEKRLSPPARAAVYGTGLGMVLLLLEYKHKRWSQLFSPVPSATKMHEGKWMRGLCTMQSPKHQKSLFEPCLSSALLLHVLCRHFLSLNLLRHMMMVWDKKSQVTLFSGDTSKVPKMVPSAHILRELISLLTSKTRIKLLDGNLFREQIIRKRLNWPLTSVSDQGSLKWLKNVFKDFYIYFQLFVSNLASTYKAEDWI